MGFRQRAKTFLHQVGVLSAVQPIYFNIRSASLPTVAEQLRGSTRPAKDGLPVPPGSLVFDVIGCHWRKVYLDSGALIVDDMDRLLGEHGSPLRSFADILDFGCGVGRLIRHVRSKTAANLSGTDYNPELIAWCSEYLPFASFDVNELEPPLRYSNGSFDFIYARSVLTHIPEAIQAGWLSEWRRCLRPGGRLYFTMHGRLLATGLGADERDRFERDEIVVKYSDVAGQNLCSTYATKGYVESNLLEGYALESFLPGRNLDHLRQDAYLFRKI